MPFDAMPSAPLTEKAVEAIAVLERAIAFLKPRQLAKNAMCLSPEGWAISEDSPDDEIVAICIAGAVRAAIARMPEGQQVPALLPGCRSADWGGQFNLPWRAVRACIGVEAASEDMDEAVLWNDSPAVTKKEALEKLGEAADLLRSGWLPACPTQQKAQGSYGVISTVSSLVTGKRLASNIALAA